MRVGRRIVAIVAVLIIAGLAAYEVGFATNSPQVSVAPSSNLVDGQMVTVRVAGLGAGMRVAISECANAASANDLGCGAELAAQPFTVTGDDETGSVVFTVHATAQAGSFNVAAIEGCSNQCVIVATVLGGHSFVFSGITFEAP